MLTIIKKLKLYWIALLIPVVFVIFYFILKAASGPYWQFPDPCYGYLSSSVSLFRGFSPTFNYQPGTSVEILGAIVIFLLNIGQSSADAVHHVLLEPNFYLNAINVTIILFTFLASFILGAYVYHKTNDKFAVLLSQLPILSFLALRSYSFYDYVLPVVTNVSPEPLLIGISCLFNLCFLKLYFTDKKQDELIVTLLLALICGLGISTRLTFIPFLLIPLIVCRGWMRPLFMVASAMSCVFWTIPIIPSYGWVVNWIMKLLTHKGGYGSGAEGFIDLPLFVMNWHTILGKCGLLILFSVVAVLISLWQIIKKRNNRAITFLLATAFCLLLQLCLIAKHYDDHYLVSAITLFGSLFVLFYLSFKNKTSLFKSIVFIGIALFVIQSLSHAWAYNKQLSRYTKEAVRFNDMLHAKYPDFIYIGIFPMPMSNDEAAFFWGNDRDNRQQDELSSLYPKSLAYFSNNTNDYAPYVSGIYSIKQRVWADDLITSGARVLFIAPKGYDFSPTPYTVMPVEQGEYAAAYLLVSSTEKQANAFFDASVKLSEQGDIMHAFAYGLKSRELHYQPVEKVELLLSILYQHIKH